MTNAKLNSARPKREYAPQGSPKVGRNIRLEIADTNALETYAKETGESFSAVIRQAIREKLNI
jgi:hypothetical protein